MENYWTGLQKEIAREGDLEGRLDVLRKFKRARLKEIQERDREGRLPLLQLFETLTALAEAVLRGGVEIASQELSRSGASPSGPFAVIAMGKFGGREMTYHSDLDILYLFERPEDREFYTRLGQRIISTLTLLTRFGSAYSIDASLRPSGGAGTLVSTLDTFKEYHREMGRTWERQSLIKARPVEGPEDFLTEIRKGFEATSYRPLNPAEAERMAGEIRHLRDRMERELAREREGRYNLKTGRGGIVDIEFLVQYLQLKHGCSHPEIRSTHTVTALRKEAASGLLTPKAAERLERAYLFLREIETRLRLVLDRPTDELLENGEALKTIERDHFKGRKLMGDLLDTREEVRRAYEEVLGS